MFLFGFVVLGVIGLWFSASHIITHGVDRKTLLIGVSSIAYLGMMLWMVGSIPVKVVFNVQERSIAASYLIRPTRTFRMERVIKIEWRTNMYAQQPALLLHFGDGQRLLVPPATHDSRIDPIVSEMRRMTAA